MSDVEFLERARQMVRISSVTTEGTRPLAHFLRDEVLRGSDLDVTLEPGPDAAQVNLLAAKGLGNEPPILLNSHLDTVPAGDPESWTECGGDPFAGLVRDGFLYGLGSADAKLDWLCKATAMNSFRGRRFRRGVILAGTFGEERGLLGARALVERLPENVVAAWAGEPTELRLVTRHKGLLVVSLEADEKPCDTPVPTTIVRLSGRSAHSSTPHLGDNAIFRALDLCRHHRLRLVRLDGGDAANKVPARCEIEVVGEPPAETFSASATHAGNGLARPLSPLLEEFLHGCIDVVRRLAADPPSRDDSFAPPFRTASLGRAVARPDHIHVLADVRCLPADSPTSVREDLERFVSGFVARGLAARMNVERDNPALEPAAGSPAVAWSTRSLAFLGRTVDPQTKAGCTEAGLYASAGIPSVVFGPGVSVGNVHVPNERVAIAELEGATTFYRRLLQDNCLA